MKRRYSGSMNTLLKLEFFKSLGFPSKESGVEFINQNKNLRKEIEEKVEELEEARYEIIESIKEEIFSKYSDKKSIFLIKIKNERKEKLATKKELEREEEKRALKDELRAELKREELDESNMKIMKKYAKAILAIDKSSIEKINILEELFLNVIRRVDSGEIERCELVMIEKTRQEVEKAIGILLKASKTLEAL